MKKKVKIVVIVLILALVGVGGWFLFSRQSIHDLTLYGNVDQRQVELAFIDSERIAEVLVEEGEEVQPDQVLARLETRRLRDRISSLEAKVLSSQAALTRLKNGTRPEEIDQARSAVAAAKAEAEYETQRYDRYKKLLHDGKRYAVSIEDVDEARSRCSVAQANLVQAQKALALSEIGPRWEDIAEAEAVLLSNQRELEELRNQLGDAELKSPAKSVVRSRLLEPGDMASPQRAVFSLAVFSPKWVRAYISEPDLGRVKPGITAKVYTDSHPDVAVDGTVGFISSVAEFTPKTVQTEELRTALVYEIRVYVQDHEDRLRLGMPATVVFPGLPQSGG